MLRACCLLTVRLSIQALAASPAWMHLAGVLCPARIWLAVRLVTVARLTEEAAARLLHRDSVTAERHAGSLARRRSLQSSALRLHATGLALLLCSTALPERVTMCAFDRRCVALPSTSVRKRAAIVLLSAPQRRCAAWRRGFQGQACSARIMLRSPQRCCSALPGSARRQARLGWALGRCQALCGTSSEASGCLQQPAPLGGIRDAQIDEVLVRQVGQRSGVYILLQHHTEPFRMICSNTSPRPRYLDRKRP